MYSPPKAVSYLRTPIIPRRVKLDFGELLERGHVHPSNTILTSMIATLSGLFPPGEKEFIQSVRLFMADLHDPELIRQVELFSRQEAHHALQHRQVNAIFEELGYCANKVARLLEQEIERLIQERSREQRLAVTVVMEHYTASMAHFALSRPEHFDVLPAAMRELLFWHAIEEIEHKAVAFEVYDRCVGDRKLLRRIAILELFMFPWLVASFQRMMLRERGTRPSLAELVEAGKFLLGPRGLMPTILPQYLAILRPNFHPWDFDDSELVEHWTQHLSSVTAAAA